LAKECGVTEVDLEFYAVHKICKDESSMEFFIGMSTPEGRLAFLQRYVRLNNLI
jgi:hypothetical protein